MEIQCFQVRGW